MFNSGLKLSNIDGSEFLYEITENQALQIPIRFSYMKNLPEVLDQGNDPICVPCSISAWGEYQIALHTGINKKSNFRLFDIFNSRTTKGEGMTCKEAFKYIIEKGAKYKNGIIHANKYYKVNNFISLRHAILNNGPCVIVLPVYDTTKDNFWEKIGKLQGYHAVAVVGYDENGFIIRNSWGCSYGENGYYHISNTDINHSIECWTLI